MIKADLKTLPLQILILVVVKLKDTYPLEGKLWPT